MANTKDTWLQTSFNRGIKLDDISDNNQKPTYGAHIDWKEVNNNLKKLNKTYKVKPLKGRYDTIGTFQFMEDIYNFNILDEDKVQLTKQII